MGLIYTIPFKDFHNNDYRVEVYREDYEGSATELKGAPSAFVVSGTDENFMYTPIRTSKATINVLDLNLLLDLYSINNQYAQVKFFKNGVLEWTGYIKPEQFTQPYMPNAQNIGVECISAIASLEHIEYKPITESGNVLLWDLIASLINKANAGYKGVYIPNVYGKTSAVDIEVMKDITLIENNFTTAEMNLYEVMEAVCKFLNWTLYDIGGYLYFVDADWKGEYRLYNDSLSAYTSAAPNNVLLQDIGYNGSGSNTLDMVPGYNKASVKALNRVFDEPVKDEAYDILKPYADGLYYAAPYKQGGENRAVRKQFLKPVLWELFQYDNNGVALGENALNELSPSELNHVKGAILIKEADYKERGENNDYPADDVTDFDYQYSIQMRISDDPLDNTSPIVGLRGVVIEGEHAVYADCAISIDCEVRPYFDRNIVNPQELNYGDRILPVKIECGGKFYNGEAWVDEETILAIELDESWRVNSTRNPFSPYKGLSGYMIPIDYLIGKPIITVFIPSFKGVVNWSNLYCSGTIIKNFNVGYAKKEGKNEEGENGDRVYENVVNESYMSACDEIEFDISSYNADGASYSKALLDGNWLTNNLYCRIVEAMIRPEELLIRRIVNRYSEVKVKLTETINMTDLINPLTILSDRSMVNRVFRMTSGTWDYEQNRLTLQMQEDVE